MYKLKMRDARANLLLVCSPRAVTVVVACSLLKKKT